MEGEMIAQEPVQAILHSNVLIECDLESSTYSKTGAIVESLAYYAKNELWEELWNLADRLKREVSILFDVQDLIWVDIAQRGMVRLAPPMGARLPFRLWIHTHPWDAYWSITDRQTLSTVSGILERALVLGHDHLLQTVHSNLLTTTRDFDVRSSFAPDEFRLAEHGTLAHWTDEPVMMYSDIRINGGI